MLRFLSFVLALGFTSVASADDGAAIDYRKNVMRTLAEESAALSYALKSGPENAARHKEALTLVAGQALKAFETKAEGGNAKPEVWTNWADFSAKLKTLSCQECHDTYRTAPLPADALKTPADAVQYRQRVMKSISAQSEALGQILSQEVPDANLISHLDVLALSAANSLKAFEPNAPGGTSKPKVWQDWPDFSKRLTDFAQKTAEAAKTAKEQGVDAALPGIMAALSCKGCHDVYREEK